MLSPRRVAFRSIDELQDKGLPIFSSAVQALTVANIRETFKDGNDVRGFVILLIDDERCDNVLTTLTRERKKQCLQEMITNGNAIARAAMAVHAPKSLQCVLVYDAIGDKPGPRLVASYNTCTVSHIDGKGPQPSIAKGGIGMHQGAIARILYGIPYAKLTREQKNSCSPSVFIGTGEGRLWKEVLWVKRCSREEFDRAKPDQKLRKQLWKKLQQ